MTWCKSVPRPNTANVQERVRAMVSETRAALTADWRRRQWSSPAPPAVKRAVLRRNHLPGAVWIETGTYRGDTTEFLSRFATHVYTIEPAAVLSARAQRRFRDKSSVTVISGTSEEAMSTVLESIQGPVCFWLDGHFSSGETYRGLEDSPIRSELAAISQRLNLYPSVRVLVDDWRCFRPSGPEFQTYPLKSDLVAWAEANDLTWTVEHDIFIASSPDE
jgi:hypothetical protein